MKQIQQDINEKQLAVQKILDNREDVAIFDAEKLFDDIESLGGTLPPGIGVVSLTELLIDSVQLSIILREFGLKGEAIIREVGGKAYVIIKGMSDNRKILTGTRYLASNPKIVNLGIGTLGASKSVIRGCTLTIFLYVGIDVLQALLNDDITRTELLGTMAADVGKAIVAQLIGMLAGVAVGGFTSLVAAPLIIGIFVGVIASMSIDAIDRRFGLTEALIEAFEDATGSITLEINSFFYRLEREIIWRVMRGRPPGFLLE